MAQSAAITRASASDAGEHQVFVERRFQCSRVGDTQNRVGLLNVVGDAQARLGLAGGGESVVDVTANSRG